MEGNDKRSLVSFIASMLIVGTVGALRRYIPLSSPLLAFFRGLIGGAALLAFVLLAKRGAWKRLPGKTLAGLVLNGAFLGINWILLFEAFAYTTVAKATLCYYLQPTLLLLLSPLVFKEKLTAKKLLCAFVSLFGMALVSGVTEGAAAGSRDFAGVLLGIGAAGFYTLVVILNKKVGDDVDPYEKTVIQLFSAAAALLPWLLLHGDFKTARFSLQTILLLGVAGVIYTGVVYALYFGSMRGLRAQTISALGYIDPITAMLVSAVILREKTSAACLVGAALIIGAALVSENALQTKKRRKEPPPTKAAE